MESPVTTLTFLRYSGLKNKWWGLSMMRPPKHFLHNIPGLLFWKLLGTGAGRGFRLDADFSVYAFLATWESRQHANDFVANSALFKAYHQHAKEVWTVFMIPLRSHGLWDGKNPFQPQEDVPGENVAVITRATIARKYLLRFWKYVPAASQSILNYSGLKYAKGIGEWPVVQMATFSLWKDEQSMQKFAYQNPEHRKVIQKTRELNWYSEELFARFRPVESIGSWKGRKINVE